LRDIVEFVEGEPPIERRVAGRGETGGMRERRETDVAFAPGGKRPPVERESRGRRLEGDRVGGDPRPCVSKREHLGNVGVLDRPSMPREILDPARQRDPWRRPQRLEGLAADLVKGGHRR
jgi:hypothetical protein